MNQGDSCALWSRCRHASVGAHTATPSTRQSHTTHDAGAGGFPTLGVEQLQALSTIAQQSDAGPMPHAYHGYLMARKAGSVGSVPASARRRWANCTSKNKHRCMLLLPLSSYVRTTACALRRTTCSPYAFGCIVWPYTGFRSIAAVVWSRWLVGGGRKVNLDSSDAVINPTYATANAALDAERRVVGSAPSVRTS